MKRMSNRFTAGQALVVLGLCLALAPGLQAADSDLSTSTSLPSAVSSGQEFTVTVGYANAGPDEAVSAYPNHYFVPPEGLDVLVENTPGDARSDHLFLIPDVCNALSST